MNARLLLHFHLPHFLLVKSDAAHSFGRFLATFATLRIFLVPFLLMLHSSILESVYYIHFIRLIPAL